MAQIWQENWLNTREIVGWIDINKADDNVYRTLGFKCGLEVHQQLATRKKLFCRCPAGIYHDFSDFDAEIIRHMRPTLSELGEYDGTALMEFKTRKEIVYRIKNDSACTYETDDTPPFPINREALEHAMKIALLLKMNIVGELHITRKQYLDGSIPTGFQRTTILGIEGEIPISNKTIRIIQFSVEEDSCREVSDYRHRRVYFGDRLGMPLCEVVTYPDMSNPSEAAEAGYYIRYLNRCSGVARSGIGAARQDVNVSIEGGTRVEIKGVAHISWIPKLTHNEAFRQKALLMIKDAMTKRVTKPKKWNLHWQELHTEDWGHIPLLRKISSESWKIVGVNLPEYKNILSHFTQPGQCFADELSQRLKVIACLEHPNMYHSEELVPNLTEKDIETLRTILKSKENDAQILLWTPEEDLVTAIETIHERCMMAFDGVPNETRKSLSNGTSIFERVLPGADRMYPDTDSAPIPILEEMIESARKDLPADPLYRMEQLKAWNVPLDAYAYLLRFNMLPAIESISGEINADPRYLCLLYAHMIKSLQGDKALPFGYDRIADLFRYLNKKKLTLDIMPDMVKILYHNPNMVFSSILQLVGYIPSDADTIYNQIPLLHEMFMKIKHKSAIMPEAEIKWIMGRLRKPALGNISLKQLRNRVTEYIENEVQHA